MAFSLTLKKEEAEKRSQKKLNCGNPGQSVGIALVKCFFVCLMLVQIFENDFMYILFMRIMFACFV
jgi:hypothetical protein